MTRVQWRIHPGMRLAAGVLFILLSLPSLWAKAVSWEFHGVDNRVVGWGLAAFGCWAVYDGLRGLLRARSATK